MRRGGRTITAANLLNLWRGNRKSNRRHPVWEAGVLRSNLWQAMWSPRDTFKELQNVLFKSSKFWLKGIA